MPMIQAATTQGWGLGIQIVAEGVETEAEASVPKTDVLLAAQTARGWRETDWPARQRAQ